MANPTSATSPLFSRILTLVGVLAVLAAAYWFITSSLSPVDVPPPPPGRGMVKFDPNVDVSKDYVFSRLRPLAPVDEQPTNMGRTNPFIPPIPEPIIITPNTSTIDEASTTEAIIIPPIIITPTTTGPEATPPPSQILTPQ